MKTIKVSELFNIDTGKDLIYSELESGKYLVVGQKAENNGVVGTTKKLDNYKLYKANSCITLAHIGNFYATIQPKDFYIGTRVKALIPKKEMTFNELMYYAMTINANKYKFNYGRVGANRIDDLLLPDRSEIPDWIYKVEEPDLSKYKESFNDSPTPELNTDNWKEFKLVDLFELENGKGYLSNEAQENPGENPFVCSSESNNGIACYTSLSNKHKGNCITINKDGSVGCAFYQEKDFSTNKHVIVATPKFKEFNKYIAMFMIPIIELEKFRYSFGRAWGLDRMKTTVIKLPITSKGEPDYQFMEDYIKTLPYSKYI